MTILLSWLFLNTLHFLLAMDQMANVKIRVYANHAPWGQAFELISCDYDALYANALLDRLYQVDMEREKRFACRYLFIRDDAYRGFLPEAIAGLMSLSLEVMVPPSEFETLPERTAWRRHAYVPNNLLCYMLTPIRSRS